MDIKSLHTLEEQISKQPAPFVIMGIGIPGSGKTTVLRKLAGYLGTVYISSDEIREEVTGSQHEQSANSEVWAKVYRRVETALLNKESVIVDATHIFRRRATVKLYQSYGAVSVIAITFHVPLEIAKQRNAARERTVDSTVLEKMQAAIERTPVDMREGFNLIVHYESNEDK